MSDTDSRATHLGPQGWNPAVTLVESALAVWLGFAYAVFAAGLEGRLALQAAAGLGLVGGLASTVAGGTSSGWRRGLIGLASFALLAKFVASLSSSGISGPKLAWFTAIAGIAGAFLRRPSGGLQCGTAGERMAEAGRWALLLAAGTLLMFPYYTHRPIGSGDAHWYTLMLSDFVLQIRSGVFPVWVGQTEYAFNGAVNPLRLAPWFQHAGALLDLATMQVLDFIALKNALLCLNFLLLGGTTYACLRRLSGNNAAASCWLTLLLLASPAILAPLYTGDLYMTFFAFPFAGFTLFGLTRVLEADRWSAYAPLCTGLAGLWLAHTPLAVWSSLIATIIIAPRLLYLRPPGWWRRLGFAAIAFIVLGTYPVVSVLHLENTVPLSAAATGGVAAEQVVRLFPAAFLPLSAKLADATDYQPGYALLLVAALSGLALYRHRPAPLLGLATALGLLSLLLLPVPAWANLVWRHLPDWLLKINGAWPHQRLFPLLAITIVFLGARLLREWRPPTGTYPRGFMAALALVALGWSGTQAAGFIRSGWSNTGPGPKPALGFQTNNLSLTRYAFSSFGTTPGYYSHGYINPLFEHRLLRPDGSVLLANAPAATQAPAGTRLAAGVFTAVNDNNTAHYNLEPRLTLPAGQQLLLRFAPLDPVDHGWLQVVGEDIFREYILPDSGTAAVRSEPRSFGTLPGLSPYVPLLTCHPGGETPRLTVILPDIGVRPPFAFAEYELWQVDSTQLPVAVRSWAPYRLHVRTPEPALVESPRVWLPGYRAQVGDRRVPVQRSADGLAMFPVPAGESNLLISYAPQLPVALSYWLTLFAWGVVVVAIARYLWRGTPDQRISAG